MEQETDTERAGQAKGGWPIFGLWLSEGPDKSGEVLYIIPII